MRNEQLEQSPNSIHVLSTAVKYALIIFILMLLDNLGEFFYNSDSGLSGAYLFFNTVVYPAGLFQRYLSPCLLFQLVWKLHNSMSSDCSDARDGHTVIKKTLHGVILSGVCYALSRAFFLVITRLWFPFVSEIDLAGNFVSWPYYDLSLKGNESIHQLYIILFGFLYGALLGSFATLCCGKAYSFRLYMIIPFVSQIIWIHLCQTLSIPPEYRLDLWLYMSEFYQSYALTALLSLAVVIGNVFVITLILKYGGGNNGQNHGYNQRLAEEEPDM